jgi:hypothetical protein
MDAGVAAEQTPTAEGSASGNEPPLNTNQSSSQQQSNVSGAQQPQQPNQASPNPPQQVVSALQHNNKPHEKHKHVGNYEIIKSVGEGSFATVKLAVHRITNQKVITSCYFVRPVVILY